jgi:hypothetical protein
MSQPTLEKRVKALESFVAELKSTSTLGIREKDWRRTIGMFTGDKMMKRIDQEALKYREADRRQARRRRRKTQLLKP